MLKKRTIYASFFMLLFSIGIFVYFDGILSNISITSLSNISELEDIFTPELENNQDMIYPPDSVTKTPGNYKTVAYFTQDNFITMGGIDLYFEWEDYNDIKNDESNFVYVDFMQNNYSSNPSRYWHPLDTYDLLWSSARINSHYLPSIIFSPEYDVDTYIQGNVYFMCGGDSLYSSYSEWTLKFTLELFNPVTEQTDFITSVIGEFDDTDENPYGSWDGSNWDGWVYEATIPDTLLIPAGYRLRTTIETMLTSASYTGPAERIEVRTGQATYPTEWTIDSTNDTYDNNYHIQNSLESIGMQVLMYQDNYPTIDLTGLENNTIYSTSTEGTITISSDSVLNRYKWDTGGYTYFGTQQVVSVPETTGWHTLIVQAYDLFDNLAQATYNIGFDETTTNIILHTPSNNSLVTDGQLLNFSIYDYNSVTYEWDKNGTEFPFLDPFDIYPNEGFEDVHQLTISINDNLGTQIHDYLFDFDNIGPEILLVNVLNETTQPQLKNIDLIIDDSSYPLDVVYKWDNDVFSSWSPILGNLYRTYLPAIEGWHNLTILANDSLSNQRSVVYSFNTSLTLLNVDLYNLVNASYYQGGNIVEVAITNDNGTVVYFWGKDPWIYGSVDDGIMTLSGVDALSDTPGTYILTVIVGNTLNVQYEFKFIFYVDKEAPTLVQTIPIPDYNGSRFLDNDVLSYTISDNWTTNENLIILYSFNGENNLTLQIPYQVYLYGLIDGSHNLTIVVIDIAGNYYRYYIEFIIDTTSPSLGVTITDLAIIDGIRYIHADTLVDVSISDADPVVNSYYSWNSTIYLPFTDSFTLPAIEGYARLDLLANDSLGNYQTRTYLLTIDASPPTIDLLFIENHTKINDVTPISFHFEDINDNTIAYMEYQWDLDSTPSVKTTPEFNVSLTFDHQYETSAIIYLYTYDVVGNEYSCEYEFILDFEAPTYNLLSTTNNSYITGGEMLDFDVPSPDINRFLFKWDDAEDYSEVADPWDIMVPIVDGNHTLYIRLEDDAGLGLYPNYLEAKYVFIIDDIELIYMEPLDFTTDYYYTMNYGEEFNFSINVRDRVNQTEIEDLILEITRQDLDINLVVDYSQYNETVYNFTIHASNITNSAYTYIDFEFYQFVTNKQLVRVYIKVNRQQGTILTLDIPDSVVFENDITLSLQLRDDTNTTGQEINYMEINEQSVAFEYTLIDPINFIYSITFSSDDFFSIKGTNTFEIYVQSNFYFGVQNDTSSISITILPVPIILSIDVNNLEIIFDNDLIVTATLTRLDSTPIQFATIVFSFEIHYKNGSVLNVNRTTSTNINGLASESYRVTEEIEFITVSVLYNGSDIYDPLSESFSNNIIAITGGLSLTIILIIIGSAVLFSIITGFVIYRLVRTSPFEDLMEKVTEVDISENTVKMSPGVILSIFDQTKGPIPLITNQSFDNEKYSRRMRIGAENFLLKISDQAYSSLGFEEHDERRRIGSINLPNEDMIGFIHGIQLENKAVRGGFENLSLIVLADVEFGGFLLANQEFMFPEIDELIFALRAKKSLPEIEEHLAEIRNRSVIIMITASKNQKKDKKNLEQYK